VGRTERAIDAKHYALGIFFNIQGAFDNTPVKAVTDALMVQKVPLVIRNWITDMFIQ